MAFDQIYKKRGGPSKGESTFETSEEETKAPEIGGIMDQIDKSLNKTINIVVEKHRTMDEEDCTC